MAIQLDGDFGIISDGNIQTGNYYFGNGRYLTGIQGGVSSYSDANVIALMATGTIPVGNIVAIDANTITANAFIGNGALLTGLPAGYSNTNAISLLNSGTFTGDIIPAVDMTQSLGNSTNQWKDLWISGNTIYIKQIPLSMTTGNNLQIAGANLVTSDANGLIANASIVAANVIGAIASAATANTANTVTANAQPNITSLGILTSLSVTGNVTSGNVTTGIIAATGNITTPANIAGGNLLTSGIMSATGNATAGNFNTAGQVSATGNITSTATVISANVATGNITAGNTISNTFITNSNTMTMSGNSLVSAQDIYLDPGAGTGQLGNLYVLGNLQVAGTITTVNSNTVTIDSLLFQAANSAANPAAANGGGLAVGPAGNSYATWTYNAVANTWNSNLPIVAPSFVGNGAGLTNVQGLYGNSNVSLYLASGTDTANIITTGNISGNYHIGNGSLLTGIVSSYGNANVSLYLASGTDTANITTTGNISGANFKTAGIVSATGNVTGNYIIGDGSKLTNLPAGNYSDANVTTLLSGNTVISNINTTGNIAGTYFIGNGSLLTGIVTSSYGDSNVTSLLSGNTVVSNVITTANISASYFIGNGSTLSNIAFANVDGLGNIASINLDNDNSHFLNGEGNWVTPTASLARRNITKVTEVGMGGVLIIADQRLFCIKGGSGGYYAAMSALGTAGFSTDNLRGINNCYEIPFYNEPIGTTVKDCGMYGASAYALMSNGNLYTWGLNNYGQLGLGDQTNRTIPTLSNTLVTRVFTTPSQSSGGQGQQNLWANYLLIERGDGSVWGCGFNSQNQFGFNNSVQQYISWTRMTWIQDYPISVWPVGNFYGGMVVQQGDGTIWVAGRNEYGELGTGGIRDTWAAKAAPLWQGGDLTYEIKQIVFGTWYSLGNGGIGEMCMLMLLDNGATTRLVGSGGNQWGQLGNGTFVSVRSPVVPLNTTGLTGRTAKLFGPGSCSMTPYVLQENGDLFAYGRASEGQVGNGSTSAGVSTPYKVMTGVDNMYGDVQGCLVNGYLSQAPLVRKRDGTLWTWGFNGQGQVGDYTNTNALVPKKMLLPPNVLPKFLATGFGNNEGCARIIVTDDNQLWVWGYSGQYMIDATSAGNYYTPVLFNPPALTQQ